LITAVLFGASAFVFFGIQRLGERQVDLDSMVDAVQETRRQFAEAWHRLQQDRPAYMSVIIWVLASTAGLVATTLMPRFIENVLAIPVRNAIFVLLPAALGIVAGLRLVQWLERRVAKPWLVGGGFTLLATSFIMLALTRPLGVLLEDMNLVGLFDPGPLNETAARIGVVIVFSTLVAFSYAVVGVASRALVNERMPVAIQGRVFAAQTVLTNLASIPPILLAGLLATVFGVEPVLVLTTVILVGVAAWAAAQTAARPEPLEAEIDA
jgi:Na+/melibiose symporter-like transporter